MHSMFGRAWVWLCRRLAIRADRHAVAEVLLKPDEKAKIAEKSEKKKIRKIEKLKNKCKKKK